MTYSELAEWVAFSKLFPFGEEAEDIRLAMVSLMIAQTAQTGKRRKRYKLNQFMPFKRYHLSRPKSGIALVTKVVATFKGLGMKNRGEK